MNKLETRPVVIFLPEQVRTGGDRYLVEVSRYLKRQKVSVEVIHMQHSTKEKRGLLLALDCLLANFT